MPVTDRRWSVQVRRFIAADPRAQVLIPVVLVVPLVSAGAVAITGRAASALFGLTGLPSIVIGGWLRQRGDWALDRSQRAKIWDMHRTGCWSGDPYLDAIAAYQLEQANRSETADKVSIVVMILAAAVAPVAAALRTGSLWWLLALIATLALAALFPPVLRNEASLLRDRDAMPQQN